MSGHLVTVAPTEAGSAGRAGELLAELDEWFEVSPSAEGTPRDGHAVVEVGGHILDLQGAQREVSARLDQIDPSWHDSLQVI